MIVGKMYLEGRIGEIRCWLDHHHKHHPLRRLKEQSLNYYIRKMVEAEELTINRIKI